MIEFREYVTNVQNSELEQLKKEVTDYSSKFPLLWVTKNRKWKERKGKKKFK